MTNEMTVEEAIKWLKDIERSFPEAYFREWRKALDLAMKALEPKPMEKFDDVKTHIQRLAGDYKCWDNRLTWEEALELNRMLEAQPNSNEFFNFDAPMVKKSDAVSREAVFHLYKTFWRCFVDEANADIFMNAIRDLPSVTPERPKGKWIEVLEHRDEFGSTWHYECSECRASSYKGFKPLERYCPNCGAEMGGGEE